VITPQKKSIESYLTEALKAEEIDSIDLWLGYNSSYQTEQLISYLNPKAFIPHHWGGVWSPFFKGLGYSYSNKRMIALTDSLGIAFYAQEQYMDKYRLTAAGVEPIPNDEIKRTLGF